MKASDLFIKALEEEGVEFSTLFLANSCKYNWDMTIIIARMLYACDLVRGKGNLMQTDKINADIFTFWDSSYPALQNILFPWTAYNYVTDTLP